MELLLYRNNNFRITEFWRYYYIHITWIILVDHFDLSCLWFGFLYMHTYECCEKISLFSVFISCFGGVFHLPIITCSSIKYYVCAKYHNTYCCCHNFGKFSSKILLNMYYISGIIFQLKFIPQKPNIKTLYFSKVV